MEQLDYIIILLYFLGLIAVSVVMSRKIKNSEDMFIAGEILRGGCRESLPT